jgi:hypothetical protein
MFDAPDEEVARYRALSSLAVAGLLAGLLAPLAMLSSVLWLVPLVAVVLSALALRRIATRGPDLVGRPLALAGLLLGTLFLVAAPVDDFVYRYFFRQQARQFAAIWTEAVRHGEVYKAHHLMVDPAHRQPLESKLEDFYKIEKWRQAMERFRNEPAMRTLFALRADANIRFYETAAEGADFVQLIYAVTYPDEQQQPKSFFITLTMQRTVDTSNGRAAWTLIRVEGGVRPPGW